jgi:hypothetical protein
VTDKKNSKRSAVKSADAYNNLTSNTVSAAHRLPHFTNSYVTLREDIVNARDDQQASFASKVRRWPATLEKSPVTEGGQKSERRLMTR